MEKTYSPNRYDRHNIRDIYGFDVNCSYICYIRKEDGVMARDYIGRPWIGVDLDGTLAYYDGWKGIEHIGEPIPEMVMRVRRWIDEGKEVRIFTARVSAPNDIEAAIGYIHKWCYKHIGRILQVTNIKDSSMIELWDDRCVQVVPNEGTPIQQDLLNLVVDYIGCPYDHFTDRFCKGHDDPNLPDWYFKLCGSENRFACKKTEDIIAACWLRFIKE